MNAERAPRDHDLGRVLAEVVAEVQSAVEKFPALNSPHEGYAVIREELDELWTEIKANRGRSYTAYDEAKQTAAMALRYMLDLSPRGSEWESPRV